MFLLYIHAVSVTNRRESKSQRDAHEEKTDFTLKVIHHSMVVANCASLLKVDCQNGSHLS